MIIKTAFSVLFRVVAWILDFLGVIPSFPSSFVSTIINYVSRVFNFGAGMLFFLVRPSTFFLALDVVFFIWAAAPIYTFIIWLLRKLPFVNIS